MYVPTILVVEGDTVTTIKNIMDNMGLFRLSIVTALVLKSGFISRIPGIFLIIAGSGYLIDTFARILSTGYGTTIIATIVTAALFGEIVFPIWLLITGVNVEKWGKNALESA
jgi:hypothetical protein